MRDWEEGTGMVTNAVSRPRPYRIISGIGAGAGAALVMVVAMGLLRFMLQFPSIPELMLNPVVKLLGGQAFSDALDKLYYAGRPLMFTLMLEGTILLGVILGVIYARLARPNPATGERPALFNSPLGGVLFGLLIGVLLNTVFLPIVEQDVFASQPLGITAASPLPLWAGLMALALIFGVTLHGLLPPVAPQVAGDPVLSGQDAQAVDRRHVLRIIGGAALSLVGGAAFWYGGTVLTQGGFKSPVDAPAAGNDGSVAQPEETATPASVSQTNPTSTPEPLPTDTAQPPTAEPTGTAIDATDEFTPSTSTAEPTITQAPTEPPPPTNTAMPAVPVIKVKEITPTESFYHISKNFFDPSPGSKDWKLEIKGLVDNPYSLTYDQLTALRAVEVTTGMMCISNPIGGGLIGNAKWKGVRLADLLQKAKPKKNALELAMSAVDGYTDSITLKKALDPDVVLVWEMNGAPLTSQHGFPARLLVPGIYGMKHLKWITSIELVDYDYKGFWQQPAQGWNDPAPVNTMSRIDLPTAGNLDVNKKTTISGVAFAGDRSISKVEVSTDGGKTWKEAYVKPPLSGTSWVVWGYEWTPTTAGKYTVQIRATDGDGKLQVVKKADPYPNGATGYHSVTYRVK